MLEVRDVSFSYPDGHAALRGVNITFPKEHILGILGKSGSGKTTLLKCIGRFLMPQSGRIELEGRDIRELPRRELRRSIGIVFQQLYLFPHLTVLENMTLAPRKVMKKDAHEAEREARQTLEKLGIGELADKYPAQISGGQAQRTAIARSLLLKPDYLLLDEPTAALDVDTTREFGQWLLDLKAETTFVIVTHDILFASKIASSGALLTGGEVTHTGPMREILETAGYVEEEE
ncbi:MAG: ATP-binding cassette domain-containing protein [Candidatus Omnitrophica bacterium]|nr:ATP-binding cassette domain-containing protein [Candidatus Omnitrophota bacterium]